MGHDKRSKHNIQGIDAFVGIIDDPVRLDEFTARITTRLFDATDREERQRYQKLLNDLQEYKKRTR